MCHDNLHFDHFQVFKNHGVSWLHRRHSRHHLWLVQSPLIAIPRPVQQPHPWQLTIHHFFEKFNYFYFSFDWTILGIGPATHHSRRKWQRQWKGRWKVQLQWLWLWPILWMTMTITLTITPINVLTEVISEKYQRYLRNLIATSLWILWFI